jgi:hypothetical protein
MLAVRVVFLSYINRISRQDVGGESERLFSGRGVTG